MRTQRIELAIAVAALSCASTGGLPADPRPITPALVAEYQDKTCGPVEDAAASVSRSAAVDGPCGPFACAHNQCIVHACTKHADCENGMCSGGYCRQMSWGGRGTCPSFASERMSGDSSSAEQSGNWQRWSGCLCRLDSPDSLRSSTCGSFPCTPHGCYVQKCSSDASCAVGYCARHTGHPTGYCVTDDAY